MSKASERQPHGAVHIGKGVYVRKGRNGQGVRCKAARCLDEPADLEPFHRGLCLKHFGTYADGRPLCKSCKARYAVDPHCDELCENCHPAHREVTPFEAQVLDGIRNGQSPVVAAHAAMGGAVTMTQAKSQLDKLGKKAGPAARMKRAMKAVGIDDTFLLLKLKENVHATKVIFDSEGNQSEVPDVRGSNQALDIAFKLRGQYPGKARPESDKPQQMNVAVAILPAEEAREARTPIYTLPMPKEQLSDGDD